MHLLFPSFAPSSTSLESLLTPLIPRSPLFLFNILSTSLILIPVTSIIYGIILASISPHLLPITIPALGVSPIDVSIHLPFNTALILPPFPKWQTIIFVVSLPSISFILFETYL